MSVELSSANPFWGHMWTSARRSNRYIGILEKIFALVRALYTDTESAVTVRYGESRSEFLPEPTRVQQACVLAPSLFSVCMDWVMGGTVSSSAPGALFGDERFLDLDFADDADTVF